MIPAGKTTFGISAIGLASGALYLAGYAAQRAVFRNGQRAEVAGDVVRGTPPDGPRLVLELCVYWGATALLFGLYAWVLVLCRNGALEGGWPRRISLGFPVLFSAGLLFGRPYQSVDSLTYVAHGFMGVDYGINPYASAAAGIAYREETAELAGQLAVLGWLPVHGPSPYGALWTWIELLVAATAGGVGGALFLTKLLVIGASLGCAAMIWAILGRVRPEDRLLGTLVYLWNPLVLVEFAGEGHNDALMILLVLVSLFFTVSARPALSAGAAVLGVLVKYLPAMFALAQAIYLWRNRRGTPRPAAAVPVALALLLAAVLYAPFWIGPETFEAVRLQGTPAAAPTPNGAVYTLLSLVLGAEVASTLATQIVAAALIVFVLLVGWRARDATGLLRGCAWISIFYVLVVSAGYWPWYTALPLALMALTPRGIFFPLALVLTFCGRLVAPSSTLVNNGFATWEPLMPVTLTVGVTVPLAVLLPLLAAHRRRTGTAPKGE